MYVRKMFCVINFTLLNNFDFTKTVSATVIKNSIIFMFN